MNKLWLIGWKLSFKTEVRIVLATIAIILFLPIISVMVIANAGVAAVSSALAALNPITHKVDIKDANGNVVNSVELSTVWPAQGYISDEFGTLDNLRHLLGLGAHTGIDIANDFGQIGGPITPFMEGTITQVQHEDNSACGIYVKVQHKYNISSLYCHMSQALATKNQEVKPGDVIGLVGNTGASTGPHVHFQVMLYEIPVNPRLFMVGEPEHNQRQATF